MTKLLVRARRTRAHFDTAAMAFTPARSGRARMHTPSTPFPILPEGTMHPTQEKKAMRSAPPEPRASAQRARARGAFALAACVVWVSALSACPPGPDDVPDDEDPTDAGHEGDAGAPVDAGLGDAGPDDAGVVVGDAVAGEALYRTHCTRCHTVGRGPLRAPDLDGAALRHTAQWLRDWISDPAAMVASDPDAIALYNVWGYRMPDIALSADDIEDLVAFLGAHVDGTVVEPRAPMVLTGEQFDSANALYFERCAGCHGTTRAGATGPALGVDRTQFIGTDGISSLLHYGTPRGMPQFQGFLTEDQIERLAAYVQLPPPPGQPFPIESIEASWSVLVEPDARPTAPEHARDWEDFFALVLRDPGQLAIFDGDTKEELVRLEGGAAVHILRSSATGRYFYSVGRNGWVTLIDLWSATPTNVAEVRGCLDARSVESSKLAGYEDQFLIQGCYWPPQYVVYDGLTLEPLARIDVPRDTFDTGEDLYEVRVASIVASPFEPLWVLSLKESGWVALVDYSLPGFPITSRIAGARTLHDGGWDHTRRWFLVAANAMDQMVVIDVLDKERDALIDVGDGPHPGRGANWLDPDFGWVNATTHMGEGRLVVYGADPAGRPEHAWQVVRDVALPHAGGLFLKTHPASPWVFVDAPLSSDPEGANQVCVYSKEAGVLDHCFSPSPTARSVHFEFNKEGTEVWTSVWDTDGAVVVYDAVTLVELTRIEGLETPTGKFNVFNSAHDVY
jgi:nitrite reductase (NO-forming)/hydroxylamine reductase